MKKIVLSLTSILGACVLPQGYDTNKFHLASDVVCLKNLSVSDSFREKDNSIVINVSGTPVCDTEVYYRVMWFDGNNISIKSIMSRTEKALLREGVPFNWTKVSPQPSAKTYKVYISGTNIEQ